MTLFGVSSKSFYGFLPTAPAPFQWWVYRSNNFTGHHALLSSNRGLSLEILLVKIFILLYWQHAKQPIYTSILNLLQCVVALTTMLQRSLSIPRRSVHSDQGWQWGCHFSWCDLSHPFVDPTTWNHQDLEKGLAGASSASIIFRKFISLSFINKKQIQFGADY